MLIFRLVLRRIRNVPDKRCKEIKTHVLCLVTFFPENRAVCEYVEKYGRARQAIDDNIIQRMRFACWIPKAADTPSEYVILIAFPPQQWLLKLASFLRLYVYCLAC